MLDLYGIAWRLGATLFFVALNGFFVAAEFALVKVRAARIDELAGDGLARARSVRHILGHLDLYLSACQLGITLASLALGALGEPAVSRLLLGIVHAAGLEVDAGASWLPVVSIILAFAIITILHMTVGEQAPKMLALRRAEPVALGVSSTLRAFTFVFRPLIALINSISNRLLRLTGLPAGGHEADIATVEEIRGILALSARAGKLSAEEYEITRNVLRLTDLEVRHIMVPRVEIKSLSLAADLEANLRTLRESTHSRLPLCERGLDTIIGFIHVKDVLAHRLTAEPVDLRALARDVVTVPDTMALSDLLHEMQSHRVHLAAVVDEHGTLVGIAFREDALEEIVGPLGDEFDDEADGVSEFQEVAPGHWLVRGRMAFPDLCARLELEADDEGEETVSGYFVARLGRLPRQGDSVALGRYRLTADELKGRRVSRVLVDEIAARPEAPDHEAGSS
jgi:CBS domain containing-hemolysin-like protein